MSWPPSTTRRPVPGSRRVVALRVLLSGHQARWLWECVLWVPHQWPPSGRLGCWASCRALLRPRKPDSLCRRLLLHVIATLSVLLLRARRSESDGPRPAQNQRLIRFRVALLALVMLFVRKFDLFLMTKLMTQTMLFTLCKS